MKQVIENIKCAFKEVYKSKSYLILTLGVAALIFAFNILVINYELLLKFYNPKFIWDLLWGTYLGSMAIEGQITLPISSLLTGILVSFFVFKLKYIATNFSSGEKTGLIGTVVGILVPACSSCGLGILALLGYAGLIGLLPFHGLELGVIGILLLVFAISYLSGQIVTKYCKVKIPGK